jgi:hypothetical protein
MDLAWLRDGWLAITYYAHPLTPSAFPELWRAKSDGSSFSRIALAADTACQHISYKFLSPLADGRVAVTEVCDAPQGILPPARYAVIATTTDGGSVETLSAFQSTFNPSTISWNLAANQGVASHSSGICARIAWLTRSGVEPIHLTVSDGGRSWQLDDPRLSDSSRCDDASLGRADGAEWSPDGRTIAFWASPQSIGHTGQSRLDAPWNLYVMDASNPKPEKVLSDIAHPGSLAWSPDGRWLVLAGDVSGKGKGTWLFAPANRSLKHATTDELAALAWSPDGQQVAGIWDMGKSGYPPTSQIVVLDVRSLLR